MYYCVHAWILHRHQLETQERSDLFNMTALFWIDFNVLFTCYIYSLCLLSSRAAIWPGSPGLDLDLLKDQ